MAGFHENNFLILKSVLSKSIFFYVDYIN